MQKTAIVTGAARGIGLATTKLFLAEGRRVAMIDRDAPELAKAAAGLENVLPVVCDVSKPDEVESMVSEARDGIAAEVAGVKTSGLGGLRSLVGSLKDLRGYGDEVRGIVSGVTGTLRLLNPAYLLMVLGSAVAAGFLAVFLVGALLLGLVF